MKVLKITVNFIGTIFHLPSLIIIFIGSMVYMFKSRKNAEKLANMRTSTDEEKENVLKEIGMRPPLWVVLIFDALIWTMIILLILK